MLDVISATQAQNKIQNLIEETAQSHRPILITTENNNAVLLSEDDWNALQETLNLLSVSGMRDSLIEEMNKPNSKFMSEKEFLSELEKDGEN